MSVVLTVDGAQLRRRLRAQAVEHPHLVPVIKGNGYGFGRQHLAQRAQWLQDQGLGTDTIAVGTYAEVADVAPYFDGDIVVLTPWQQWSPQEQYLADSRIIHTVATLEDLHALNEYASTTSRPRILLEYLTQLRRFGFSFDARPATTGLLAAITFAQQQPFLRLVGISMHLPQLTEFENANLARELLTRLQSTSVTTVWGSHLSAKTVRQFAAQYPQFEFYSRIGTSLWLGDETGLAATSKVLATHELPRGTHFGYRGRWLPLPGHLVVVSGGTAHGLGLDAPAIPKNLSSRFARAVRGGLDSLGLIKSPFWVAGKARYFAEPPHMQTSMLFLPANVDPPEVGETVKVRVRYTTTHFDEVIVE